MIQTNEAQKVVNNIYITKFWNKNCRKHVLFRVYFVKSMEWKLWKGYCGCFFLYVSKRATSSYPYSLWPLLAYLGILREISAWKSGLSNDPNASSRKIQLKFKLSTMEIKLIFRKSIALRLSTFENNNSIHIVPTHPKVIHNIGSFDLLDSINKIPE